MEKFIEKILNPENPIWYIEEVLNWKVIVSVDVNSLKNHRSCERILFTTNILNTIKGVDYEKRFNTKTFPSFSEKCSLESRLETEVKGGTSKFFLFFTLF